MVNINLNQLRVFLAVVENESLTLAAKKLRITVQAVSQAISKLEESLEMSLMTSTSQKITFTPSGRRLYIKGAALLNQHDKLISWTQTEGENPSTELNVVVQSTDFYDSSIAPFLAGFYDENPGIKLNIELREELIKDSALKADVYWGVGDYLSYNFGSLKYKPLMKADYGVYASAAYLDKYGVPKEPDDLYQHKLIGNSGHLPPNALFIRTPSTVSKEMTSIRMETSTVVPRGHLELGLNGLGVFNLNSINQELPKHIQSGHLVPILEKYWYKNLKLMAYFHHTDVTQKSVRCFLDYFMQFKDRWKLSS